MHKFHKLEMLSCDIIFIVNIRTNIDSKVF